MVDDAYAAASLRRWRRQAGLTVAAAATELGVSRRMLAYYETGDHPAPRAIQLAVKALSAGMEPDAPPKDARRRWVALVERMRAYGDGAPVFGQLLRARDEEGLADMLRFVRLGPDPRLAMTDPALFKTLRGACTKAQLAGLGQFTLNRRAWRRHREATG